MSVHKLGVGVFSCILAMTMVTQSIYIPVQAAAKEASTIALQSAQNFDGNPRTVRITFSAPVRFADDNPAAHIYASSSASPEDDSSSWNVGLSAGTNNCVAADPTMVAGHIYASEYYLTFKSDLERTGVIRITGQSDLKSTQNAGTLTSVCDEHGNELKSNTDVDGKGQTQAVAAFAIKDVLLGAVVASPTQAVLFFNYDSKFLTSDACDYIYATNSNNDTKIIKAISFEKLDEKRYLITFASALPVTGNIYIKGSEKSEDGTINIIGTTDGSAKLSAASLDDSGYNIAAASFTNPYMQIVKTEYLGSNKARIYFSEKTKLLSADPSANIFATNYGTPGAADNQIWKINARSVTPVDGTMESGSIAYDVTFSHNLTQNCSIAITGSISEKDNSLSSVLESINSRSLYSDYQYTDSNKNTVGMSLIHYITPYFFSNIFGNSQETATTAVTEKTVKTSKKVVQNEVPQYSTAFIGAAVVDSVQKLVRLTFSGPVHIGTSIAACDSSSDSTWTASLDTSFAPEYENATDINGTSFSNSIVVKFGDLQSTDNTNTLYNDNTFPVNGSIVVDSDSIIDSTGLAIVSSYESASGNRISYQQYSFTTSSTDEGTQAGPTPAVTDTEPTPPATNATPTPTVSDATPTPTVSDAMPTPTVTDQPESTTGMLNLTLSGVAGVIDNTNNTISVILPYGISRTNLVAAFTLTDGSLFKIGTVPQISGVTSNDYTNPVVYSITGQDGTVKNYVVTVSCPDAAAPTISAAKSSTWATTHTIATIITDRDSGVAVQKWAEGTQDVTYFATAGTEYTGDSFTATESDTYTIYAKDNAGNESIATVSIISVDSTPPTITLEAQTGWAMFNILTATITDSESGVAEQKWAAGNQDTSYFAAEGTAFIGSKFSVPYNGIYTIYARDMSGNESVATITVTNIDTTPLQITATQQAEWSNTSVLITTTATDNESGIAVQKWAQGKQYNMYFVRGGGTEYTGSSFSVTKNGVYTVFAKNNADNPAIVRITVTHIDTTAPVITASVPDTWETTHTIATVITDSESGIAIQKWAKDTQNTAYFATAGTTYTGDSFTATEGGIYTVYAKDNAGNESIATVTVTAVDSTPPTIILEAQTGWAMFNILTATITDTGSGVAEQKWASGNQDISYFATEGTAFIGTRFSVPFNGIYTIYAKDMLGNESVATITVTNIDTTPVQITATQQAEWSNTSVLITTTATDNESGIAVQKWAQGKQNNMYFVRGNGTTYTGNTFSVTQNGVYTVFAKNNADNPAILRITVTHIDTTAPAITASVPDTWETTHEISTAITDSESGVAIQKWAEGTQDISYFAASGTTYTGDTFAATEADTYTVYAKDNAGNESIATVTVDLTDVTPPSIPSNVTAVLSGTDNTVSLTWTPSTDNVLVAGYKIFRNDVLVGTSTTAGFTDTGILPGTNYTYTVSAFDSAENVSDVSAPCTIVTPIDMPGNLRAQISGKQINISWDEVTGASSYDVEVDGVIVESVSTTQYTWSDEQASNTSHTIRVRAKTADIESEWTSSVTAGGFILVGGTITGDTTWSETGRLYKVESDLIIPANVTLTVMQGTVILVDPGVKIIVNGTLNITGIAGSLAVITSSKDSDYGGTGVASYSDYWGGMTIGVTGSFVASFTHVRYGQDTATKSVISDGGSIALSDSNIENTHTDGYSIFADLGLVGEQQINEICSQITDGNFSGQNTGKIAFGGTLQTNLSLLNHSATYVMVHDIIVPTGLSLTFGAGLVVLAENTGITVNGTLNLTGIESSKVMLTSVNDPEYGGAGFTSITQFWGGIAVAKTGMFTVDYVSIKYAARLTGEYCSIYIEGNADISNLEISESVWISLHLDKNTISVSHSNFTITETPISNLLTVYCFFIHIDGTDGHFKFSNNEINSWGFASNLFFQTAEGASADIQVDGNIFRNAPEMNINGDLSGTVSITNNRFSDITYETLYFTMLSGSLNITKNTIIDAKFAIIIFGDLSEIPIAISDNLITADYEGVVLDSSAAINNVSINRNGIVSQENIIIETRTDKLQNGDINNIQICNNNLQAGTSNNWAECVNLYTLYGNIYNITISDNNMVSSSQCVTISSIWGAYNSSDLVIQNNKLNAGTPGKWASCLTVNGMGETTAVTISDNIITSSGSDLSIGSKNISNLNIYKNTFTASSDNQYGECLGISTNSVMNSVNINTNVFFFTNNGDGIVIYNSGNNVSSDIFVNFNSFYVTYFNSPRPSTGISAENVFVNAQYNYWGSCYAPKNISEYKGINNGYCYVTDNVDYSNWLGQDFAKQFHYGQDGGYSPLGIYSQTFSDLKVDAPGLDVDFSRTYNSLSDKSGSFGRGWSFGFEGHCKDYKYTYFKADGTTGTITMPNMKGVTLPDGSVLTFTLKSGIWTASNSQNTFVENTDGGYTLTTKDGHVYIFNSNCYLVSVADKNGNRIAMNVDASGKVQYVTDGAGRVYTISYNADGTVSQIMDPTGRNVTYQYANGQLAGVTDALNHTIYQYSYDASGYLTQIRNAASNLDQAITYDHTSTDNKDKITSLTDKQGNTISYVYDNTNKSVTKTDSIGRQTIEWFNDAYQIIKTQDEEGKIATKTYADYSGNLSTSTDRNGNTTGYQIDANGNTTQLTNPDQSTKSYTYDAQNNRTSETDESGNRVFYVYDSSNNLVLKAQPLNGIDVYTEGCDTTSFAITSYVYYTDAESSQHGYLAKRLLKQITDPNGNATTYTYDANGYPQTVSDPSGNVTHYTYNSVGWLLSQTTPKGYTTTYDYDKTGKLLRTTDAGSGILRNVYDVVGRIIQQISPNQYNPADDGLNLATPNDTYANANVGDRFAYDTHSNVISKTDPENNTTTYTYDLYSNILSSTQPNGGINSIAYDIMNRKADVYFKDNAQAEQKHLQSFVYTILADGKTQTTTNQFLNATDTASTVSTSDYAGRTILQQNPDGTTSSVLYNTNGTVNSKTAVNGAKAYYKYDGLNRVTEQWTQVDTNLYAYTSLSYDKAGNQIQQKSGIDAASLWSVPTAFITTSSTYYPNGKQQSITDNEGRKNVNYYDADGNLIKTEKYTSPTEFTTTESSYNYLEKPVTVSSHVRTGDISGNNFADNSDTVLTTHYTYDKNGNALTVTTPNAVTTTYTYDRLNRQTQVSSTSTDENGQPVTITSSVTYTWDGKVQTSTDANGNISSNVYDTRGLLTKTIDACGNTTAKYYDNAGRLIAVVSALNYDPLKTLDQMSRTEYAYDLMGNVKTVTQTYYDNQTNEWVTFVEKAYQYDSLGNVTKEIGAIGYASGTGTTVDDRINTGDGTLYFYNLGGKLTLKLTSNTEPTQYTYDALGRVTSKSNERGVKTGYTYDGAGKLLTEKVYIGALSEEQMVHSYTYDLLGQVLSQTDGNGNTTTYTYNALGKVRQTTSPGDSTVPALTSYCQYNTSGNISDMWTSAGKKETDTYDNQGHILSKTQSAVDGTSPITVSYRYDKNGNLRFSTDGNGNVTSATYDAMNRVLTQTKGSVADGYQTTTVTYDANGNKVTTTDWRGNTSTNMYDAMNRLIEQKDAYGHTVEKYTYNNNSLQVTATDALGNVTAFAYDREDRLIQTTDPAGHVTSQVYNNLGLVDSKTDGNGNTTSYLYDQRSRLHGVVNAANEATFYTYDANGNVLTQTDGLGHVTTYEYNCRNQLTKTINDGGKTGTAGNYTYDLSKVQSYTYTADGQAATKTDRNGNTTTYTYDIHGNLLSQTVEAAAGSTTGSTTVSYTYDSNGNTLTTTDTTGTTTRVYDSFNRTTAKTVPDMGTSTYAYDITAGMDAGCTAQTTTDPKGNVTQKIYDRVGRISQVIADGLTTVYHYNDNGSVQSLVYSDGSREDYTYTSDNHLDTLTNTKADSTVIDTYSYTYDAAHNMLSKVDARGMTAYTYDTLNRLLTVTEPSGKTTGYTYDASGNRLTETDTLGTDITVITYAYDSQNRLTGTVTTLAESTGTATITSTVAYTYDNNGNQLSKTTTAYIEGVAQTSVVDQANAYDLFNQLIATVTSAGVIVLSTYNGDGLRVGKSVNGELTRYLYEYQKVVLEENASGDQTGRNVYGINLLTRQAKDDTDTPAYTLTYMYNGHADVTALLDTAGNVVATYYYDAFGNILAQTGTVNNSILYTGYQYDKETGLYYLNARMYDPVTARFMQEDTYTGEYKDPLSLNLYTYCNNDPLMYSDPTGHFGWGDFTKMIGDAGNNVAKTAGAIGNTVAKTAGAIGNTVGKTAKAAVATATNVSKTVGSFVVNQTQKNFHALSNLGTEIMGSELVQKTKQVNDGLGNILQTAASVITGKKTIKEAKETITSICKPAIESLKSTAESTIKKAVSDREYACSSPINYASTYLGLSVEAVEAIAYKPITSLAGLAERCYNETNTIDTFSSGLYESMDNQLFEMLPNIDQTAYNNGKPYGDDVAVAVFAAATVADLGGLAFNKFSAMKSTSSVMDTPVIDLEASVVSEGEQIATIPDQVHHFASNKSSTYTNQFENITKKYGLDLDEAWNKDLLPHQGRHPNAYHDWMLEELQGIDKIAQGNTDIFKELFAGTKNTVMENPEMLRKAFWK